MWAEALSASLPGLAGVLVGILVVLYMRRRDWWK
ncbi:hypothetical protein SEA_ROSIEPOSIE_62 [Arthrobacter phage RosiePosie]|uniref:Uncharacterized protein n=6 Tax=Klausavirus princesstrina TaxID=1984784 RepID=A0A1J0GRU0_9CAUD|nr:hypothetical protein SEA_CHUBSTER_64 [Arthrobacter phage Chubster]AOZ64728.1 hypothetical protein SEA_CHOCOLAT_63 [Arthrobacter phage Chocolat]APC44858.1 hypothetical protein SEA_HUMPTYDUMPTY_63 [Arthrobacter phage HumptyDumpty]ASX98848.1 hypothetical protein SEA_KABREEZE_63 [Arthrobacter phage Kabreeze]ASX98958.1 hypothetical protein SEA_ROSIEPOSIE_62 [Arthrobacter phage RosiePosie]QEQ94564.1 hypothetical protein SEA_LINUS_63 [Arthrobacter phage Linus]